MLRATERATSRRAERRREPVFAAGHPDPAAARGSDRLPQIEHIVVLMMENHSYDNYFGMLGHSRGRPRGDGLPRGADGHPTPVNAASDGAQVPLTHLSTTRQVLNIPTQSWSASHIQYADGSNGGFVRSVEEKAPGADRTAAMGYWDEQDLPFYHGLATVFPLATRWFCSCLGPTFPNRRFLIAGTAHGLIDDIVPGMGDYPEAGTIFDLLSAHGISWANYHYMPRLRIGLKQVFRARGASIFAALGALLSGVFPQLKGMLQSRVQVTAGLYPLGLLRSVNHLRGMDAFFADAAAGALPSVSIVDPDFGSGSEENPQDIQVGEGFAAKVINAVMTGPGWPRTLLIWLYDEHGGYFDHVPPPPAPPPDDVAGRSPLDRSPLLRLLRFLPVAKLIESADAGPATYDRLGFRVPAVIVSPYARPGYVTETVYDHTSILKLIQLKWNLPSLTRRDAAAADPLDALDLDGEPAFLTPPSLPAPARLWD
jgi:phospholipase C